MHLECGVVELLVLLELLLLLLHVVMVDTELLVTMSKAASFLIWTALRAFKKLALNSLKVRVVLSLSTTL